MALTVNIQSVQVINTSGTTLSAYVIHYDLAGQNCTLYWTLLDDSGNKIYDGNYSVPPDVLANWGTDDMVIMASLADSMNFIILPIIETTITQSMSMDTITASTDTISGTTDTQTGLTDTITPSTDTISGTTT